jgi:uncharacterized protein (TIGR04222 family)
MNWSLNLITDMPGPQFLLFYGLLIALTLTVCWWLLRQSDTTISLPAFQIPSSTLDPYEIAYLRGGENEVLRIVLFRLFQQGALYAIPEELGWSGDDKDRIERRDSNTSLSTLENDVINCIHSHTARELFQDKAIQYVVELNCRPYKQRLLDEQLLVGSEAKNRAFNWGSIAATVILGLGGYKLITALAKGHTNVYFLILMCAVAVGVLFGICSSRLTFRGKKYLQNLEAAFGHWKEQASQKAESQLLLLVGIFGATVLSGTTYDFFSRMFSRGNGNCGSCGSGDGCGGCGGCGD